MKVAFAPFLGDQDIIIGSLNEIMNSGTKLNQATKRTLRHPKSMSYAAAALLMGKSMSEAVNIGVKAYYRNRMSANPPHPTAYEASRYFPYEWENYFKFAFIRNPYKKAVSDYLWRKRTIKKEITFSDYLEALARRNISSNLIHTGPITNFEMITIDGEFALNAIGRYETLHDDFRNITDMIGLKDIILKSKTKANPVKLNYESFYGNYEKELVSKIYADEILTFGYEFPYQT